MSHGYPILLDLTEATVVIIGGGRVAERKAAGLIEAGCSRITVVAPVINGTFDARVRRCIQPYAPDVLAGATLVFAATNQPPVNTQIVQDARARGILVNRADADGAPAGDFVTPAKFVDGDVTVTVNAGSPALAVTIRDGLRSKFDPRWSAMAAAMRTLRPWLRDQAGLSPDARAHAFRLLAGEAALDRLAADGIDGLRQWVLQSIRTPTL
ncbi:MAG: precorrin-2 dehydrogenase/sirohydrochlorin ferrochelatase family protein [Tepidisphaeraceae bacterium]